VLFSIPFWIYPVYPKEVHHWLVIGEAMKGGHLYSQIWDGMAPLSATVYWWIVSVFGKSAFVLSVFGMFLNVIQAVLINNMTIKNKVYEQSTYVPAFVYIVFTSLHPSFRLLSPVQMGITFLLLALGNLLSHVKFRIKRDEQIINIGIYQGLAVLFYFPLIIFNVIFLLLFLSFTRTLRRRYALFIYGSLLPLMMVFCYYWIITGDTGYFTYHFLLHSFEQSSLQSKNIMPLVKVGIPILLFCFLGVITMGRQRRLNNYQIRLSRLFLMALIGANGIFFFVNGSSAMPLFVLISMATFFTTHFLLLTDNSRVSGMVTGIFVAMVLFTNYDSAYGYTHWYLPRKVPKVVSEKLIYKISGKSMLVLGDHTEAYNYGRMSGPFYEWKLAKPFLDQLGYYDNLVFLDHALRTRQPEIILDYEHRWPLISRHLPWLNKKYKRDSEILWILRHES